MKPPFEVYRGTDIADAEGHVCTAENPEIAAAIVNALNGAAEMRAALEEIKSAKMPGEARCIAVRALSSGE